MDVSSVMVGAAASAPQKERTGTGMAALGSETFLQLLVTQMKNQDPTAPMESTDMLAQLAQFSQVEAQGTTNGKLDSLLTSSALSQAERFVGRTLTSADAEKTGVVSSVRVFSDGLIARLEDGRDVLIEPGITVS